MTRLNRSSGGLSALFVVLVLAACNTIAGLDKDYQEVACVRDCVDAAALDAAEAGDAQAVDGDAACVVSPSVPVFDPPSCDMCIETSCCVAVNACYSNRKCASYGQCAASCLDVDAASCIALCRMGNPEGAALFDAFDGCLRGTCHC